MIKIERNGIEVHPSETYYTIDFTLKNHSLDEDEEGYDLVREFTGKIIHTPEGEAGKDIPIGSVRGERVDLGDALEREISFYDLFDQEQELCDYYEALFNAKTGHLREELDLETFGDVLIIHSVELIPAYRGLNLGLLTMLQTLKTFGGGCALAAIKPFPLQFSGKLTEENKREFTKAQNKLRAYWKMFGFRRIKATDCYYVDLANRLPRPQEFWVPGEGALKPEEGSCKNS